MAAGKTDERIAILERDLAALRDLMDVRFAAHDREQSIMDTARVETRSEMNQRLEGMNEFRQQMGDQSKTFINRSEWDAAHQALQKQVDASTQSLIEVKSSALGKSYAESQDARIRAIERMVYMASGGAVVIASLISFLMGWIKK